MFKVSSLWVDIFCLLIISPTIVPKPILSSPWSNVSKVSFLQVDICYLLIISPPIVPKPVLSSPWSDAFKVSFLQVDIFCLLIISPTRVPEPVRLPHVSLFSSHNASLAQARLSWAKHPIRAASSEPARSSPQSDVFEVSSLQVNIFCLLIISPTIVPEPILISSWSDAFKVSFLQVDIFSSFCICLECMAMGASTEESKKDPNNCATVLCLGFSFMFCMFCIACSSMSTCTLGQM